MKLPVVVALLLALSMAAGCSWLWPNREPIGTPTTPPMSGPSDQPQSPRLTPGRPSPSIEIPPPIY